MFLATHGILRSRSAFVPPVFPNPNSFEYDGLGDYIIADLDGTSTGGVLASSNTNVEFSVSIWVKSHGQSSDRGLFQWANSLNDTSVFLLIQQRSNNDLRVFYNSGYRFTETISNNVWNHIVVTRKSSNNTLSLYINGVFINSYIDNGNMSQRSSATSVYFGNGYNGYFDGNINQPSVFNYELSSSDISSLYSSGSPTDITTLNPVGWWQSVNATWTGSNWSIPDSGSENNTGISHNMTLTSRTTDVP